MNSYAALRKQNKGVLTTAVSLLLCVVLSATMLFSRLTVFAAEDTRHYIPLTQSGGITQVLTGHMENGVFQAESLYTPGRSPLLTASWFRVKDDQGVWKGETNIEIFRISYENGAGQITVNSHNGEKVIAPGTENEYTFALENTCNENVKYEMTMEAFFSDGTRTIPVEARVFDEKGQYLAGSAESYADVLELNNVEDAGTLRPGYVKPYTLQWQWPFERGADDYDTMLGNLAVDEDITLTIVINTVASYTPTADGGVPKTGDTSHVMFYAGVMVTSAAALLMLLLLTKRKQEEEHG